MPSRTYVGWFRFHHSANFGVPRATTLQRDAASHERATIAVAVRSRAQHHSSCYGFFVVRRLVLASFIVGCGPSVQLEASEVEIAFIRRGADESSQSQQSEIRGARAGAGSIRLFDGGAPSAGVSNLAWSRDGQYLAAETSTEGVQTVVVIDVDAGEHQRFENLDRPVWSTDAAKLFATRAGDNGTDYVSIDVETGDVSEISRGSSLGALAPTGNRLAYSCPDPETRRDAVCLEDLESQEVTRLEVQRSTNYGRSHLAELAWSPDSNWVAFTAPDPGGIFYNVGFILDVTERRIVTFAASGYGVGDTTWNARSDRVTYSAWGFDALRPTDYSVSTYAPDTTPIASHDASPAVVWSEDDQAAVVRWHDSEGNFSSPTYVALEAAGEEIWVSSKDDGVEDRDPAWRPGSH